MFTYMHMYMYISMYMYVIKAEAFVSLQVSFCKRTIKIAADLREETCKMSYIIHFHYCNTLQHITACGQTT